MSIKRFIKKRKLLLAVAALVVIGVAVALAVVLSGDKPLGPQEPKTKPSQLTGVQVAPELAERPILAVVLDNNESARPQAGLDSAGITFEIVTEGGITRYLALFQEDMPREVGPIRSLRTYFLDWSMGFEASFAHVGGSPQALSQAEQRDAMSLSQFRYADAYRRVSSRPAPHNVFARTADLRDLQRSTGHTSSSFELFARKSDQPAQAPQACRINIDYSSPTYRVQFRYQAETNDYVRYLAGSRHIDDASNKPVTVKNLVVLRIGSVGTDQGSPSAAIGSGQALIYRDGGSTTARWQKDSFNQQIKLTDSQGNPVPLNRGDSWFAALPTDRSVAGSC